MKRWKIIAAVITLVAIAGAIYGWSEYNREHKKTAAIEAAESISAKDLFDAFTQNETAANNEYNDKVISISGIVKEITKSTDGNHIVLETGSSSGGILCQLEASEQKVLEKIAKGKTVTIKGICTGMLLDVVVTRCVIEEGH